MSQSAWDVPGLIAWWREVFTRRFTSADAAVVAMVFYIVVVTCMRFFWAFSPWAMEGDWKQWIWQYHRYYVDGAFPPGHVITDYQFVMQPPLYFLAMAAMSHVVHPGVAARVLSILAYVLLVRGTYSATKRLSHWVVGLGAVVFLVHDFSFFHQTMGGYPRSFGPTLVVMFIDAWIARRHKTTLALLVVMAGLYPSVLPPCGLAYGVWTAVATYQEGPKAWLIRNASVVATGVVCAGLALFQNLFAQPWWGAVITLEQAEAQVALQSGGRMKWLPIGDYWNHIEKWLVQPWVPSGALDYYGLLPWPARVPEMVGGLSLLLLGALALVLRRLYGKKLRVPWELLVLVGAACVTYEVARVLAFRLYLPHRLIQHTLPYTVMIAVPVLAYQVRSAFVASTRAVTAALLFTLLPVFVLGGDGFIFAGWGHYDDRAGALTWIKKNTPVTAQFAGNLEIVDVIPYFSARQVYVNWTMAHPFRPGYWAEMERRLLEMHDALFATDTATVLRFLDAEKIDYLALNPDWFTSPDPTGRALFMPVKTHVLEVWNANKPKGFVLASPPVDAVVFSDPHTVILDAKKLKDAWR